jgi:hypothetical protein
VAEHQFRFPVGGFDEVDDVLDVVAVRVTEDHDIDRRRGAERSECAVDVCAVELSGVGEDHFVANPHHHAVALADIDEADLGPAAARTTSVRLTPCQ